jgi:hypothetical protein
MLDLLLNLFSFIIGFSVGKSSLENDNEISLVYNTLHESEEKHRLFEAKWLDAENRAETWERRYNNLISTTQVSFEE